MVTYGCAMEKSSGSLLLADLLDATTFVCLESRLPSGMLHATKSYPAPRLAWVDGNWRTAKQLRNLVVAFVAKGGRALGF